MKKGGDRGWWCWGGVWLVCVCSCWKNPALLLSTSPEPLRGDLRMGRGRRPLSETKRGGRSLKYRLSNRFGLKKGGHKYAGKGKFASSGGRVQKAKEEQESRASGTA